MSSKAKPTREAVLESAIAAFARKGYAGTSVHDILRVSGLSKPTLYYYFGSKEGLFRAILESAYDGLHSAMQSSVKEADDCMARLTGITSAIFQFTTAHEHLMRLVFATIFAAPEEIPQNSVNPARRRRVFNFVKRVVTDGRNEGVLTVRYTSDELTHAFFGTVSHQIRTWLFRTEGSLTRTRARRIVNLFLDGAAK